MKNKISKTLTDEISNVLSMSKRTPLKNESDRGGERYNLVFQNFLKSKNTQHYSGFADKNPPNAKKSL